MNYETPHAQKMFTLFQSPAQMQSPYQQLFLLQNRVPVDSQPQQAIQKIKKQLSIPKPPTQVKNKIPQKLDQQGSQKAIVNNQTPIQTYHTMIDLIRQNQDLKNELIEIEKDIQNYKSLIDIRSKKK
ncbi:unnamed protein product [Paramecium primaurelia]|uniref:Uncharacterized protein n=2 Tax=Paramecium TaxID=5884 RepID=A0A8S1W1Q1_9CILI|nr:unnamed protein product [Paramecium primaurelia]CAD8183320.1 unnamed protein product [Paramecium pentaurelia]